MLSICHATLLTNITYGQFCSLQKHPFLLPLRRWGRVARNRPPRETSPAAKSEEKRMFSQASSSVDTKKNCSLQDGCKTNRSKTRTFEWKTTTKMSVHNRSITKDINLRDKSVTTPLYPLCVTLAFQPLYLGCLYRFLLRQIFPWCLQILSGHLRK